MGAQDRFRALHVGGAACALACAWSASYPSSRHVAVEVDRLLAEQVREHFPIPKAPQVKIRVGDGLSVVEATREGSVDVIVRDAFASGVTPAHLRTLECARLVRRALTGRGVYLVIARMGARLTPARMWRRYRRSFPSSPRFRIRRWAAAVGAAMWLPWRAMRES